MEQTRLATVREIADALGVVRGPLLPVLHAIQDRFGWIDRADVEVVADVLNLSVADVHGVLTFYDDFRSAPPPPHVVSVCRGEACQSVGAEAVLAAARSGADAALDVQIREVFCLGNCALGPTATVDGRLHGRLSATAVGNLIKELSS